MKTFYGLLLLSLLGTGQAWAADGDKRGDANGDGTINVIDATTVVSKYHNVADPSCPLNADANGDGVINIVDATQILSVFHYGSVDITTTIVDWTEGTTEEVELGD